MVMAREGDARENLLLRQGRGTFQLSGAGHEGIAALAPHVGPQDLVFPAYRDRALMHALGMTIEETARDFFGHGTSSSGGRNLPGHFSSRRLNVFSITSPVGAQCLPAVGAAWARQKEGAHGVALCHIGDAATRQGEFFEAVAQARADRLPIVFVVEDNGYGISTPTRGLTPLALGMMPEAILLRVDGRDAEEVYARGGQAVQKAREGHGPSILWCELDRLSNHTSADDHRLYRPVDEIDALVAKDPLDRLAAGLQRLGHLSEEDWNAMRAQTTETVRRAYARVEQEAPPLESEVDAHLYGRPRTSYPVRDGAKPNTTMLQAVNDTLAASLADNPRALIFGEDVEDPKGGVFGLTKGLSTAFPGQVVNSPLAEATIVGSAVGLAAVGWRPIVELQFIDFVGPAFNQLIAQVANLRWRTKGEWNCPLTIVAPCGAYLPGGGMWHSQSNEGWFAGIPGLRIAVPSTPEDAAGLLWAATHDDDPSLVLLPKHLLRAERPPTGPDAAAAIPWGKGRVVRGGQDATIVAWGNGVEVAEAAADRLAAEDGTQVEIVDLRTLVPCDWTLIETSVARTGRLVVVQEDSKTGGFGQAVVSEVVARPELFGLLKAPPTLVARPDVHVPFNAALEASILPSGRTVALAVRNALKQESLAPLLERAETDESDGRKTVTIPQLGEGLRRVRITALLKRPGDAVAMDEPLYEVETDKANVVVESPFEGTLLEWRVSLNEEAEVYGPIAILSSDPAAESAPPAEPEPADVTYEDFPLSERQRAMNRSALGGRLDVPLPASVGRPLAWSLVADARTRLRGQFPRLRLTEFGVFAYAAARATEKHPKFRSSLVARGEKVRRYAHVDIGFAIALPDDELATAVVRNADRLSLEEFAIEMRARHREAKGGVTQSDARTTLLISSLAGHEVTDAAPVLFPPSVATLFLGAPHEGPIGRVANVRLAFDHRLINGAGAADFLQTIEDELRRLGTS